MHYERTMEYSETDLCIQKTGGTLLEVSTICMPVYKDVIKEMSEVIKDARVRDVFYLLSTGSDIQAVSKRTGIAPRNLAYISKESGWSIRNGNFIPNGSRNWITHMSDVEITSHFC